MAQSDVIPASAVGNNETTTNKADDSLRRLFGVGLTALGVVYGDIGTSPLYALRACFFGDTPLAVTHENVLGVLSLIFWALLVVISVKYLLFVMRADNRGEGGILALLALLDPCRRRTGWSCAIVVILGIFGAALLYGDGMITPAISVLSAVEGLAVATPALQPTVIPLTIVVLIALFAFQQQGTEKVGRVFGPIMVFWFIVLSILGIHAIIGNPTVLHALNPLHAIRFLMSNGHTGYLVLGGVFLVVTGGEALYADMGHFGVAPIRLGWFALVLPALLLNYFGQGAVVLSHPNEAVHPFYNLVPGWAVYPMVALATVVTVIASQAVISGAFSLTRQAVQLGYSPRIAIVQTSAEEIGQIYIPKVNWALMVATITLVIGFGSSTALTAAYGVAVSLTMVITTVLVFFVMWRRWRWHPLIVGGLSLLFLVVDSTFLGANLYKIADGGWLPLTVGGSVLFLMLTWRRGHDLLEERIRERSLSLSRLVTDIRDSGVLRIPGTAVFLSGGGDGAPVPLLHHLKLNQVLHRTAIILTAMTEEVPRVPAARRLTVESLGSGFYRMYVRYGFMQTPNIPVAIRLCHDFNLIDEIEPDNVTYYLGRNTLLPMESRGGMRLMRKRLFSFISSNSMAASAYYQLPPGRTIELGVQIEY